MVLGSSSMTVVDVLCPLRLWGLVAPCTSIAWTRGSRDWLKLPTWPAIGFRHSERFTAVESKPLKESQHRNVLSQSFLPGDNERGVILCNCLFYVTKCVKIINQRSDTLLLTGDSTFLPSRPCQASLLRQRKAPISSSGHN